MRAESDQAAGLWSPCAGMFSPGQETPGEAKRERGGHLLIYKEN